MPDEEALTRRLRAVERSLTDGDQDVEALRDAGDRAQRIDSLESKLAEIDDRIAELEAVTQALRGYVGNVRSVNEDVEQRADAALAAVERLEDRIDDVTRPSPDTRPPPVRDSPPVGDHRGPAQHGRSSKSESEPDDTDGNGSILSRLRAALR